MFLSLSLIEFNFIYSFNVFKFQIFYDKYSLSSCFREYRKILTDDNVINKKYYNKILLALKVFTSQDGLFKNKTILRKKIGEKNENRTVHFCRRSEGLSRIVPRMENNSK